MRRQLIPTTQRDGAWQEVEADIASGFLAPTPAAPEEPHRKARQLSDRHTPELGTRSIDLLHIAAALILEVEDFFSFDDRQRKAAASEGFNVKP